MTPSDPYPVLRLLQSHLEGRLRQGSSRLWLSAEAAENLRDIVRMKPKPRPVTSAPRTVPAASSMAGPPKVEPVPHPQRLTLPEETIEVLSREEKVKRLASVKERAEAGTAARALGTLRDRMVFAVGNPEAEIVLVGEAPGEEEERQGEPFVGPAGQLLTKVLHVMGLERPQVYITNICKFRPAMENQGSGNRQPTAEEMQACIEFVREELAIIRPKVVVALGGTAITGLLGISEGVMKVRGKFYRFEGLPVMATLDPSYLLRKESEGPEIAKAEKRKFWEDMLMVMEKAGLAITEKQRAFFLPK